MVSLDVQIISKETIKPSSPTLKDLQYMPLSLVEQLMPLEYIGVLLFYSGYHGSGDEIDKVDRLKSSLSKTLTHFYPLAGRIEEPKPSSDGGATAAFVDCKDQGVEFFEARVEGDLEAILTLPPLEELKQLLPYCGRQLRYGDNLLEVQLNVFAGDGGCVIGICISHQISDAAATALFLNQWSIIACGGCASPHPQFHSASVFPPLSSIRKTLLNDGKGAISKNFIINKAAIEKLKGDTYARDQVPTRVEAVTTLVWRSVAQARRELRSPSNNRKLGAIHAVNMRNRMPGKLTEYSFGSLVCPVFLVGDEVINNDVSDQGSQGELEKSMRKAIATVDEDYITRMVASYVEQQASAGDSFSVVSGLDCDFLAFSSWCRMPFYSVDFGWGKPVWLGCDHRVRDGVVLVDTADGEGIEVWLYLEKEVINVIEKDEEFLRFTNDHFFGK